MASSLGAERHRDKMEVDRLIVDGGFQIRLIRAQTPADNVEAMGDIQKADRPRLRSS
jgi:hypothetical protein